MSPAASRIAPPIRTRPRSTNGATRSRCDGRTAWRRPFASGSVPSRAMTAYRIRFLLHLEPSRTRSPDRRLGGRRRGVRPERSRPPPTAPSRPRRRGSGAGRRRSRPAAARVPLRPLHVLEGPREIAGAQLVPYVGPPTVRSRIAAYVPRTVRRSEPLAFGRGLSITIRSPRRSSQASSGPAAASSAVSVQPRRRSTAKESARDSRRPAFAHRGEVPQVGLVHVLHRPILDELHPARPRAADPHAASAVSHGSREIAMYVGPSSHRRRPSARSTRTTGRRATGRTAAGRSCRGASRRVRRRASQIPPGDVHPIGRTPPDHGDDRGMERDDAEDPRTHPAMVIAVASRMLPQPVSRSRLPSGARPGG